jgi:hypothetical protein
MPIEPSDEEERYFKEREKEQREKLRAKLDKSAAELEDQQKIASSLGANEAIAARIKTLGFDGESAKVFDLLPLVHVAWADGTIQKGERASILRIVEARGLGPDSAGFQLIAALLDERPSDAFMRQSLEVLKELVAAKGGSAASLVDLCVEVARASGGLLGIGAKVSAEEKQLIAQIAEQLGDDAQARLRESLG